MRYLFGSTNHSTVIPTNIVMLSVALVVCIASACRLYSVDKCNISWT